MVDETEQELRSKIASLEDQLHHLFLVSVKMYMCLIDLSDAATDLDFQNNLDEVRDRVNTLFEMRGVRLPSEKETD